jgi:hypothetical protein
MGKKGSFHPAFCNAADFGKLWLIHCSSRKGSYNLCRRKRLGTKCPQPAAQRGEFTNCKWLGRKEGRMDGWMVWIVEWGWGCPVVAAAALDSLPYSSTSYF